MLTLFPTSRSARTATLKILAGLVALSLAACQDSAAPMADPAGGPPDLSLVQNVMTLVQKHYVEPVPNDTLVNHALKGMLNGLDPHSDYLDPSEYELLKSDTTGEFGGIGIELALKNGVPTVISPIDGTPAAAAGIAPGDLIVKIDGQPTDKMPLESIVGRLRGQAGTSVKLTILRGSLAPFDVALTRRVIHAASVKSGLEKNNIGYIRITNFQETTASEFAAALDLLNRQTAKHPAGLVLDLRNNPGGLLDSTIDVAGDLLDGGTVVTTKGRESDDDHVYAASPWGDRIPGIRIAVLINGASASAAEILAGALQDNHRATVIGTRSFGKGSVQTIIPLNGEGALRLTTARYYTPSGHSIQDQGIMPDIAIAAPKDQQVPNATSFHEGDLPGALRNTGSLANAAPPSAGVAPQPEEEGPDETPIDSTLIGTAKDLQLETALEFLGHTPVK